MSRKGNRAFDRCDVKVIEFKDLVYKKGKEGPTEVAKNPSEDSRILAGNSAVLHCPRTEDDRVNVESQFTNHSSRQVALNSVRSLAGVLLCATCRFSNMNPVEVSEERARIARAEAERIEAFGLRDAALLELNQRLQRPAPGELPQLPPAE